jgi:hypothetical protein
MRHGHTPPSIALLLALLCVSTINVHAIVVDIAIRGPSESQKLETSKQPYGRVLSSHFGLAKGATVDVDVVVQPPTLVAFVVLLTLDQVEASFGTQDGIRPAGFLDGDEVHQDKVCTIPSAIRMQLRDDAAYKTFVDDVIENQIRALDSGNGNDTTNTTDTESLTILPLEQRVRMEATVPETGRYTVLIVHCGDLTDGSITGSLQLLNPRRSAVTDGLGIVIGNGHLPIELAHFPVALVVVAFLYGGLTVGWTSTLVMMKRKAGERPSVSPALDETSPADKLLKVSGLHLILLLVLMLHLLYACLDAVFYWELAEVGRRPEAVGVVADVVLAIRDASTVALFQLTSIGWAIHRNVSDKEKQFTLYLVCGMMFLGLLRVGCPHGAGEDDNNPFCVVGFLTQ